MFVPNLNHYEIVVLNLLRVTEDDNVILLQNENWFYHHVTWRGHSATTKWSFVFIIKFLERDTAPLQNDALHGLDDYLCFYMSSMQLLQKEYVFHCWLSEKPLTAHHVPHLFCPQCFKHLWNIVVWRATSLPTKWDWVVTCCLPKG